MLVRVHTLGGEGASDNCALARGDDFAASSANVHLEIETEKGVVAVRAVRCSIGTRGPLVILQVLVEQSRQSQYNKRHTSRSFFIMEVWQSSQLTV